MAAGASASGSLQSTLDKKFQNVTNTMESIQGLSTWCIENKKYHSVIVRHWIKHVRKASPSHRLNLLYLANDVIQNCKRKNAIVYRTAFAEVLLDAFLLINSDHDPKVIKSVERILTIWDERSVYESNLITELRNTLVKEESPPETPVGEETPTESKADLRSRIVAEFVPQAFIDQLSKYKRSLDEADLREKQLTHMRVDILNSETLRKLKDKAGGKKFSRDFEEGNTQLQEFVKFIEKQNKTSEPILEALSNADIFYEMQYKEVKIVANAYQTFANRVNHLKRKLDSLKATLPSLDDSPLPSPSADAPSPTGSESPFHSLPLAHPDPDLDGSAMDDDAEPPAPSPLSSLGASPKDESVGANDNREVEDMELSDEEVDSGGIIVEEQTALPSQTEVLSPSPESSESPLVQPQNVPEVAPPAAPPSAPPAAAVEGVDLGKIGSFLNSLSSVIKNTGPSKDASNPSATGSATDTTSAAIAVLQDSQSLSKLLAKVDMSASDLLSALTKVQAQGGLEGISSLLNSSPARFSESSASGKPPPSVPTSQTVSPPAPMTSDTPDISPYQSPPLPESAPSPPTETEPLMRSDSLDSKIHNFLQGNPAFSSFDFDFGTTSTNAASPAQEGTPVRDEGGSTPTQDEVMDKTAAAPKPNEASVGETIGSMPQQTPVVENGRSHRPYPHPNQNASQLGNTAPLLNYQQVLAQMGELPPGTAENITNIVEKISESGWLNAIYPEGNSQQSLNVPLGPLETPQPGQFPFHSEQKPPDGAEMSTSAYGNSLPTFPGQPRPPRPPDFYNSSAAVSSFGGGVPEQQPAPPAEPPSGVSSLLSGVIIHDHQHKSVFQEEEPQFERGPEYLEEERHYHEEEMYHHELYREEAFGPPGFGPRLRGRLTSSLSSQDNEYYDYQHGAAPQPRRPPPPPHHPEMRPRGMRPPMRAPPPGLQLRGHPRHPFPGPRGPEPWLRGKRPGPRRGGPNFPPKRPFPGRR